MKAKRITAVIIAMIVISSLSLSAFAEVGQQMERSFHGQQQREMNDQVSQFNEQNPNEGNGKGSQFNGQQFPKMNGQNPQMNNQQGDMKDGRLQFDFDGQCPWGGDSSESQFKGHQSSNFRGQESSENQEGYNGSQKSEMGRESHGKHSLDMNGQESEFSGKGAPEITEPEDEQQMSGMNVGFNSQRLPQMNDERRDPVTEAIAEIEDSNIRTALQTLADTVDTAMKAEKEARETGIDDLSDYEAATRNAMDALIEALQEAGIELQKPEETPGFDNQRPPEMNEQAPQFNGKEIPDKPEVAGNF